MTDEERGDASITDGKYSIGSSAGSETPQAVPTLSAAAMQLSFAAAVNQFNALTRFGSDAVLIEGRASAMAHYKNIFLRDRVIEIDSNGLLPEIAAYSRAVEAIRAKAAALGYGAQSQSVPITAVPGGYVGRFGGNDIYAAAQ